MLLFSRCRARIWECTHPSEFFLGRIPILNRRNGISKGGDAGRKTETGKWRVMAFSFPEIV